MSNEEYKGLVWLGEPGPELVMLPAGSSIFPVPIAALWEIAQELVETDVAHEYAGRYYCTFCEARQDREGLRFMNFPISEEERKEERAYLAGLIRDFPHEDDCIVLKARELVKKQ